MVSYMFYILKIGESKEYIDFAKQFLERRSKYKNLQRAQNAHDDDLCKPALAITPSVNDNSDNKVFFDYIFAYMPLNILNKMNFIILHKILDDKIICFYLIIYLFHYQGKQKKVKKNKMTKLDARILGFSVTAAEGRINVGDRDYGDAP